jgi:chorismate synthase
VEGFTCGAPIAAMIRNTNTRSGDYNNLKNCPRPGHADYTAQIKYGGFQDAAGGGHFSGRLTAPLCIAGGMCKQWLEEMGIRIGAHISIIAGNYDVHFDDLNPEFDLVKEDFPVLSNEAAIAMKDAIAQARAEGDSVGGEIECAITGLPVGLGEPMFGGIESRIAQIIYGIPAVKYLEFGGGMAAAYENGSSFNDPFIVEDGVIRTETNNAGGILGGISNGMPVILRVGIKPTPSIAKPQQSVCVSTGEEVTLEIKGRHDPCIVPRAVPVVEAAAAIAIYDLILGNTTTNRRKPV